MSKVTCVAPWFGSNRMLAHRVGELLEGCPWVGIPFAGGMAEVPHITARTINVNDLHRQVINLASVMAHPVMGPKLYRMLRREIFHPDTLAKAQRYCGEAPLRKDDLLLWAKNYFISAWMSRHGEAGTKREFSAGMSTRWNAGGGDSAAHYHGAVRAILDLRRTLTRCNFTCLDWRVFLQKCKDEMESAIYCDSPFFGPGDRYVHTFTEQDHRDLAAALDRYQHARIVCRYYRTEFVERLYPTDRWTWLDLVGRKQTNDTGPEVLITRNA
ncbi:MAG: DNA adenine methylase [Patescibacteria group bacterium]|nr:DNA adenine methylase [Patescibacteria group bacterium]